MANKKRKPPAKTPVVRQRVPPESVPADPLRPDPDQPPLEGPMGRPSVYSEWINSDLRRPGVFTEWVNSPPPGAPRPSARPARTGAPVAPAASLERPPPPSGRAGASMAPRPTAQVARPEPAPHEAPGGNAGAAGDGETAQTRRRRTSAARRLSAADRLNMDVDTLESPSMGAATPVQPTRARPIVTEDPPAALRRQTAGRLPSTLGESTARVAVPPQRGAPTPIPRPTSAGRAPALRPAPGDRWPEPRQETAGRLPVNRRATAAQPVITREGTAADLPTVRAKAQSPVKGYESPDSALLIRGARHPQPSLPIVPRRLRPPSAVMQIVVALVTVVFLLSALSVVSPLGYGAAISGTIQAYANAIPWVPTPTPTPRPAPPPAVYIPASPGQQVVINEIQAVFGQYATGALNIARCESGFDPAARNPYPVGNSHAEGVFQILFPSTWDTTSYAAQNPYDYNANIHAAWEIFTRDGYSWREWACRPY